MNNLQISILKIMVKKENSEENDCINNILKFEFKKTSKIIFEELLEKSKYSDFLILPVFLILRLVFFFLI